MNAFHSKTVKILAGTALATATLGGAAMPAMAADAAPAASSGSASTGSIVGGGNVNLNLDPVAISNAIKDQANDKSDRGAAVRGALEVAYYDKGNPDRMTVAIVKQNEGVHVDEKEKGAIAYTQKVDIKGGTYTLYVFKGKATVNNEGDGGWLNWGAKGNVERVGDQVMSINGA